MSTNWFKEIKKLLSSKRVWCGLGDLNLLECVALKSDKKFNDDLNEPLANLCAIEKGLLEMVGKHWWTKKNFIPFWF